MAATSFSEFRTAIDPAWIDYNEHLNDAAYAIVLTRANEALLEHLEMGAEYRKVTGRSLYTVDLHLTYRSEVGADETLQAHSVVVELGAKKLRVETSLVKRDGTVAAVGTVLYLHYDGTAKAVTVFSQQQLDAIAQWLRSDFDC